MSFEVVLNGNLIFSKLECQGFPFAKDVIAEIKKLEAGEAVSDGVAVVTVVVVGQVKANYSYPCSLPYRSVRSRTVKLRAAPFCSQRKLPEGREESRTIDFSHQIGVTQ